MSNFKHTTLDGKLAERWETKKARNLGCKKLQVETNGNDGCGIMNESICCEGLAAMMKLMRRNWSQLGTLLVIIIRMLTSWLAKP